MSSDARSAVLGRIRAALRDNPRAPEIPRDYDHTRDLGDVVEVLAERVADYRATVHRVSADRLPVWIDGVLDARGARRIAVPADVPQDWCNEELTWLVDAPPLSIEQLDGCDGVLTGCAVAIAETGTIVLDAGAAQGRRALTLLPDYHLCVVRADQVVATVPEALARLDPVRPLTFISGPSATSDIELDRVEGVHGPRTLEVLIVT
ncbi:L-lactate dehydrogenase complex protein LldG [Crossiella equi]|uniref:L-lactate dehydrogenase complex protein LldG n=1 Tax=Crossiella equi TaxID=130796 RepID=A0ABS5AFT7_9PSEU|nr:lactate utilization protein C [Crossiella equi]MBP2475447.1 L-lactate dehydrogenase complex protein LldG [Crossiella equi]